MCADYYFTSEYGAGNFSLAINDMLESTYGHSQGDLSTCRRNISKKSIHSAANLGARHFESEASEGCPIVTRLC